MGEAKGLIITGLVTLLILGGGIFLVSKNSSAPSKPNPVNMSILINANSHQTNRQAKVTVVEFGDYRCPACKEAYPTTKQILKDYGDKINFVFRNYAFLPDSVSNSSTTASTLAANAAECASDEGKFWEMHDYFYENQPDESNIHMYNVDTLTKAAVSLRMDENKFKSCLTNKTDNAKVQQDFADGQLAGITGTPTFFINGQALSGIPNYIDFKSAIDPLLTR